MVQAARRYSVNAILTHKWLRDPRFGANFLDDALEIYEEPSFLPVEIEAVGAT